MNELWLIAINLPALFMLGFLDRKNLKVPAYLIIVAFAIAFLSVIYYLITCVIPWWFYPAMTFGIIAAVVMSINLAPNPADGLVFVSTTIGFLGFGFIPIVMYSIGAFGFAKTNKGKEYPALWYWFWICLLSFFVLVAVLVVS